MKIKILLIEDEPSMRLGMQHFLTSQGFAVSPCADGDHGIDAILRERFDLIITDLKLPRRSGFEILEVAREKAPNAGVIIITAYAEVRDAVKAIKEGAFDYIAKPFSNDELIVAVERYLKYRKLEDEVFRLRESLKERRGFADFIGASPAMMDVFDRTAAVAATDVPVLIQGESGTGKELVANAVHGLSGRSDKPFIKINCAAMPENLFESELFGAEKGAFTGAHEMRKGRFEFAHGGSIFFDEIADIPPALQPKLLRVLEEKTVTRLGSNVPIPVDVRTICASGKNLKECVAAGTFRSDLFYRINVVPIKLPPLRERPEDIPYFIDHFVRVFSKQFNKGSLAVTPQAYDMLLSYRYPGNVRELKHALERAVIFAKDGVVDVRVLPDEMLQGAQESACGSAPLSLEESVRCFEKRRILKALQDTSGKKQEAAELLGISRKVLWKKMKDYGIEDVPDREQ
ncbi:MAG: acetoacetate metabolism regulatory protein AtoC [Nitrospirae bacterium]|nr:MAG: acetoacetate metabolism regulatory protein AtoC [Nitrospirota bacterium]